MTTAGKISLLLVNTMICFLGVRCFSTTFVRIGEKKTFSYSATFKPYSSFRLHSTVSTDDEKKRVVFLGTPEVAADSLRVIHKASLDSSFKIVGVVTQPAKRRRRKGKPEPSAVGIVAEELDLLTLTPEKANDKEFLDELADELQPDLCITAAYGQYLPKRFLATPPCGTVNIHPSLLPRWRGASPVQRSLQAGDNPVGVTVLFTVSKMDAGPIIAQKEMELNDQTDTATNVLPELFELGTQLLLECMPDILSGKITMETAQEQEEAKAVKADLIHSSEAELKLWDESAISCHNKCRGFSMWPQTYLWLAVEDMEEPIKVKVLETRVVENETTEPTDIVQQGPTKQSGLYVVCHDGSILELITVQPATRKAFPAKDFKNGYPGKTIRWVKTPESAKK